MSELERILKNQIEFQRLCEVDIDTKVASKINELSEMYLFKAIEEVVELRKTLPSELNKWAKNQGLENHQDVMAELSDVFLFMINFCIVRGIDPEEVLRALGATQEINFIKLKQKKLAILNEEISRVPGRIGYGGGNVMPSVVIIGLNPGQSLDKEHKCWDTAPKNSTVGFLKKSLKLGEKELSLTEGDIYFTNLVKEVTDGNEAPTKTMVDYWFPYVQREIEIVSRGCDPKILMMGKEVTRELIQRNAEMGQPIIHPSYFMRNGFTENQYYQEQLKPNLKE